MFVGCSTDTNHQPNVGDHNIHTYMTYASTLPMPFLTKSFTYSFTYSIVLYTLAYFMLYTLLLTIYAIYALTWLLNLL